MTNDANFQIWAVGRNYADHAKELGNLVPSPAGEPMIFLKAGACAVPSGGSIRLPAWSNDIHHELEIALRFGTDLEFSDLALALDLTARDAQTRLKNAGHPWTLAKSFTDSCPLGTPVPLSRLASAGRSPIEALETVVFRLLVNGELRQKGCMGDMIHKPRELGAFVRERFPVRSGDWLLTGTPAGVARLQAGDHLEANIEGLVQDSWTVATA